MYACMCFYIDTFFYIHQLFNTTCLLDQDKVTVSPTFVYCKKYKYSPSVQRARHLTRAMRAAATTTSARRRCCGIDGAAVGARADTDTHLENNEQQI